MKHKSRVNAERRGKITQLMCGRNSHNQYLVPEANDYGDGGNVIEIVLSHR